MSKAVLGGLAVVFWFIGAACSSSGDDTSQAALSASPTPQAAAPQPEASPPDESQEQASGQSLAAAQLREFVFNALIEEDGISQASAQCVVDNLSQGLLEDFFQVDFDDLEAAQPVLAEMFRVQSQCLTPQELEMTGFMPPAEASTG